MHLEVTDTPKLDDAGFIAAQVRAHNIAYAPGAFRTLCVFLRAADKTVLGGLTGRTHWDYLDIDFLWVAPAHRGTGLGTRILQSAEREALRRDCRHALLSTFDFQAPGFYLKAGYTRIGLAPGYRGRDGRYDRHFMHKVLAD